MKIVVGSIMHETNTFTDVETTLKDFAPVMGTNIFDNQEWAGTTTASGIIDTLKAAGLEVVPTLFGKALPSGLVGKDAYVTMKNIILDGLHKAAPIDGVCLALHGSMYVDGLDDPEGDLLEAIRNEVGENVPIVCGLDMHATVTQKMISSADSLTAYRTAPHVDKYDTGVRAAKVLLHALREKVKLYTEWVQLPMLLSGEQSETDVSPMKELIDKLVAADGLEGLISTSYMLGFPWADTPHNCVSIVAVGDPERKDEVRKIARSLAQDFWAQRENFGFSTKAYSVDACITEALANQDRPVIIADAGDNPTAGATQNMSVILKQLLERKVKEALVAVIADQEAYEACLKAGVGAKVDLQIGRASMESPDKLPVKAIVRSIGEAQGTPNIVLDIEDVTVIISNQRTAVIDPQYLYDLGLDPLKFKIIVVKSGYLSPEYQAIAVDKMLALTPGDTNIVLPEIKYNKVIRPIFPLDAYMEWKLD